jgi:fructokinase
MSAPPAPDASPPTSVLCLGEALVDMICERHVSGLAEADSFVPRFGGAVANVAVTAARRGARVTLAGGAGDDAWGGWLRDRLRREGVDVSLFELVRGTQTPVAMVSIGDGGEASYQIYGEGIGTVVSGLGDRVRDAVRDSGALFFGSNTLVGGEERAVTMRAREAALEHGRPVIFDPNFRLHRWKSHADAAASANACVHDALLVRCNLAEATLMTGEEDPERAALALVKGGARLVVVTLGRGRDPPRRAPRLCARSRRPRPLDHWRGRYVHRCAARAAGVGGLLPRRGRGRTAGSGRRRGACV